MGVGFMAYIADWGWWEWMGVDGGREDIEKKEIALTTTFVVGLG